MDRTTTIKSVHLENAQFLFAAGEDPSSVARRTGVRISTLRRYFRDANLPWTWQYDNVTQTWERKLP